MQYQPRNHGYIVIRHAPDGKPVDWTGYHTASDAFKFADLHPLHGHTATTVAVRSRAGAWRAWYAALAAYAAKGTQEED